MYLFLLGKLVSAAVQPLKARLCFAGRLCRGSLPCAGATALPADSSRHCNGFPAGAELTNRPAPWRPLVLLIPLRLGLTDINEAYVETLKVGLLADQQRGEMLLLVAMSAPSALWPLWTPGPHLPASGQS